MLAGTHTPTDILIQDEKIIQVGPDLPAPANTRIIDARDKWIFPGIIDPHTHMGIPIKSGQSADSFATGSRSALHGGVTSILDFTVLEPGQSLRESLDTRIALAQDSLCDVGVHVNLTRYEPALLSEIPELIADGFNSFKVFTTYEEAGMMLSYPQIEAVAEIIARHDGLLMVHSEDNDVITQASARYVDRNETHPRFHGLSRPGTTEREAIRRLGEVSKRTGCRIYIVHLNTAEGLALASDYPNLLVETCPHYLLLTEQAYERADGQMFVASPPLRTLKDQDALWKGLVDGSVDTIGSDHCPFCLNDKPAGIPFQDIPNGMGGVETLFPTLLAQFIASGLDPRLLTDLTSSNAARIFGLDHRKGSLEVGKDADLLIVDPQTSTSGWESKLDTHLDWNAYAGLPALFPETVIRRGAIAIDQGKPRHTSPGQLLRTK